ncbi:hypothetical protein ACQ0P8_16255 (plasmid) [Halodesulfovibrio aestuarii]|uniref:Uncharacterized protein n=1 Tax=Halodesulfovibrio aestuarii TaxID=126333 RepID=A0A8G2CC56_9BACT|nr:hypothetical protein [Halodesulfovibrio aestuarii]SHJ72386.1 hypothetical protein SAMN05660830_03087 [Halodesulfovibrio aestuarii]
MKRYYSPSENCFPQEGSLPEDAILISEDNFLQLLRDQERGMAIQPDENGHPVTVTPPPAPEPPAPTEQELAQQRITEITQQLTANDLASVRPLRAIFDAQKKGVEPNALDEARLTELEEQAQALRAELVTLNEQLNADAG